MQWPIRDPGSRAAKSRSWVKVLFLDQISKSPCQPDMSLGFILSMRIYSDGHCTKPNVGCSFSLECEKVFVMVILYYSHPLYY